MNRLSTFLVFCFASSTLFAQVPPGDPYDPAKHVNPIITYVQAKDFKPSNYKDAEKAGAITLLGLSKDTGTLESIELADAGAQNVRQGRATIRVTYYAVVQQTFKLSDGKVLVLDSFKAPRVPKADSGPSGPTFGLPFPTGNRAPPKDKRFGSLPPPEDVEIRGHDGLLFEKDDKITVAWQEDGVIHTATSTLSRKALFRVLDDLL